MSISAVIITKNEEKNIARAIESCLAVCDEIIIMDSQSIDKTKEIATKYDKVKFFSIEWQGFSKTKNLGNLEASGDYILSIDADEALSAELQREIMNLSFDGSLYRMPRLTKYGDKWIHYSDWRPDYQERLFPRDKARWNDSEVHERLEHQLEVKSLKSDLLHYSYYSISDHIQRIDSYTNLGAQIVFKKKKKFLLVHAVFRSHFKFFRMYIMRRGFLDGFYGFVIAVISAYVVFIKYVKAAEMVRKSK